SWKGTSSAPRKVALRRRTRIASSGSNRRPVRKQSFCRGVEQPALSSNSRLGCGLRRLAETFFLDLACLEKVRDREDAIARTLGVCTPQDPCDGPKALQPSQFV